MLLLLRIVPQPNNFMYNTFAYNTVPYSQLLLLASFVVSNVITLAVESSTVYLSNGASGSAIEITNDIDVITL